MPEQLTVPSTQGGPSIYVNGAMAVHVTTGGVPADLPNDSVNYLGRSMFNDPLFLGRLDEVAIYDYPLTEAQVAHHFALAGT